MKTTPSDYQRLLHHAAAIAADRTRAPYSGRKEGCALLLSDGHLVPGCRVESAAFSLVIPAIVNAFTTAAALGRTDIVAVAMSRPLEPADWAFLETTFAGSFEEDGPRDAVRTGTRVLPDVRDVLNPFVEWAGYQGPEDAIDYARRLGPRAVVPESNFPVACYLVFEDDRAIPGVNVEHADWTRILCAERNALGTMVSYGRSAPHELYLSCLNDPAGSPCGACRQLLVELAPDARLWMDRGDGPPGSASPADLLPGAFAGASIRTSG